mmetsp:Transcript_148041/g.475362  ORF Transcript_148041/g.475362 Transcript_148041/m.475362 type:complete len:318 (-) Transcript_148041:1226-2179(-)
MVATARWRMCRRRKWFSSTAACSPHGGSCWIQTGTIFAPRPNSRSTCVILVAGSCTICGPSSTRGPRPIPSAEARSHSRTSTLSRARLSILWSPCLSKSRGVRRRDGEDTSSCPKTSRVWTRQSSLLRARGWVSKTTPKTGSSSVLCSRPPAASTSHTRNCGAAPTRLARRQKLQRAFRHHSTRDPSRWCAKGRRGQGSLLHRKLRLSPMPRQRPRSRPCRRPKHSHLLPRRGLQQRSPRWRQQMELHLQRQFRSLRRLFTLMTSMRTLSGPTTTKTRLGQRLQRRLQLRHLRRSWHRSRHLPIRHSKWAQHPSLNL